MAVDCGLLSKELAASALFGHEKGAFTGAENKRKGFWEEAYGGTLFLDEIGNLPLEVQQMMLRALESKRYRPVGSNKDMAADVRIIAATNEDMQSAVAEKRFRQDLFHRIKEYTLNIPPLRECRKDIMPLADFFRELANKEFGKQVKGFDAEAGKRMLAHPWGGNVRELKGTVRSAVLFTESDWVTADKMEFEETPLSGGSIIVPEKRRNRKEADSPCFGASERQPLFGCRTAWHRAHHAVRQDETIRHQVKGIRYDYRRSGIGCPTSEEQPSDKAFGSNPEGFE